MRFKNMLLVGFMSLCSLNANADVQITIYNQDLALIVKFSIVEFIKSCKKSNSISSIEYIFLIISLQYLQFFLEHKSLLQYFL